MTDEPTLPAGNPDHPQHEPASPETPPTAFRRSLEGGAFVYGAEIVSTRGLPAEAEKLPPAVLARELAGDPRIAWVSITDNPGGSPMLPPDGLAALLPGAQGKVVIHLTCKDMNRSGLESYAWRLAARGLWNVLALTGDYPVTGFGGRPTGVFDLDSVGLISLLAAMNRGLEIPGRKGGPERLRPTAFYLGCAVSPFKRHERELVPQYFKLVRKIAAGAQWVITQLGYDMRKFHEVKLFLQARGIGNVPLIGNVYVLTKGIAKVFHSGRLPGCVVSDELLALCEKYGGGPDRGAQFFRELAAKQLAVFKGLGFAAGYLGGLNSPDAFFRVIELAESFGPDDWRQFLPEIRFSLPGEFFFFEHDPETGLSGPDRINREYLQSLERPRGNRAVTLGYRISRLVHRWAFTRDRGLWGLLRRLYARWDKRPSSLPAKAAYAVERFSKFAMYGCQDCGDCSLPDCAYICPKRWCSKCSRNGPCGGSSDGQCELQDKECLWAKAYQRLMAYGETDRLLDGPPVIYNAELQHTSSWANTFLDRDHHARRAEPGGKD
ncbi:MAG: methylenetetrahydrofolate reductase [Thermogutta sp.]|nr:methylenetetrahydrofolate reductase [Thermogutta sp.]